MFLVIHTHTYTNTNRHTHTNTNRHTQTQNTFHNYNIQFYQCLQSFFSVYLLPSISKLPKTQLISLYIFFCIKFRIVFSLFSYTLLTISINLLFFSTKQKNSAENSFIHYKRNKQQFIQNEAQHALGPMV